MTHPYFKLIKRVSDDKQIYVKSAACPSWVEDMIYSLHNGMLPDDWTYEIIAQTFEAHGDYDSLELADSLVDIYTNDLYSWGQSHRPELPHNFERCDTIEDMLRLAQFDAILEIVDTVYTEIDNNS